jgi:hypothetical protein
MLPIARFRSTLKDFIALLSLIALCAQLTEVVVCHWHVVTGLSCHMMQAGKCWTGYDCNQYATSTITANGVKYCCYLNGGFPSITQINSVTTCNCGNADEEGLFSVPTVFCIQLQSVSPFSFAKDVRRSCYVPIPITVPIPMATAVRKGWPQASPHDHSVLARHLISTRAACLLLVIAIYCAGLAVLFLFAACLQ